MEVSFTASAALAITGGATLSIAPKKQRILAIVPLLFAIQQFLEGIQWMYLNQGSVCKVAGYGFLFFALILWPTLIPVIIYVLDKQRRKFLKYMVVLGGVVSLWSVFMLVSRPLVVQVIGQHIFYDPPGIFTGGLYFILYLVVVLGSSLISSKKGFQIHGLFGTASALLTVLISSATAASVWCLFGAVISAWIFVNIRLKLVS